MFWIRFIKDLKQDYDNGLDKQKMRDCYIRYFHFYFRFIFNLILAPIGYTIWWIFKKPISKRLYRYFKRYYSNHAYYIAKGIYEVENIDEFHNWLNKLMMTNIDNNKRLDRDIRTALPWLYYKLYLFGDAEDPLGRGGLPLDYRNGKNTFLNRFLYSAIRNPWGNGIHLKMRSSYLTNIITTFDTRTEVDTTNYGTGNARVGTLIRWYTDSNDELWYFYERVYKNKLLGWRDFYFGGVGCGTISDGKPEHLLCTRWEQSNRECKLKS